MVLHFLINVLEKPVIPNIQSFPIECNSSDCFYNLNDKLVATFYDNKIEKLDIRYHTCVRIVNKQTSIDNGDDDNNTRPTIWYSENDDNLGALFLSFIVYYSRRKNYKGISITFGDCKLVNGDKKTQQTDAVWVQDPFLVKKNIA